MATLETKTNQQETAATQHVNNNSNISGSSSSKQSVGKIFDLDGVTCEPAIQSSSPPMHNAADPSSAELLDQYTLWNFHCDGATYPARLINLPCPVEIHKTHDHAMFYKCVDLSQMLIVYEDMTALEEAESMPGYKHEAYPSYYHSGLTPPLNKVVQRRFMQREHSVIPPPIMEVIEVEKDLVSLIEAISTKDPNKRAGRGNHGANRSMQTKILEAVEDEIVSYEPWMDDYGKVPKGIKFEETDPRCKTHPELWLDPEEIKKSTVDDLINAIAGKSMISAASGAIKEKKKKKSNAASKEDGTTEKKTKKKKKKKVKEEPIPPPPEVDRPLSVTPAALDSLNFSLDGDNSGDGGIMDTFDFDLDALGDDDFDMEATLD
jgi:transcription initiation factor TFIID subunit 7